MNKIDKAARDLTEANRTLQILYDQRNRAAGELHGCKQSIVVWERSREVALETLRVL